MPAMNGEKEENEEENEENGGEEENEEGDAEEAEISKTRKLTESPTKGELEEHRVNHLPFRSWCRECVAGRAKDWGHRAREELPEDGVPEIHMDYCFLRNREGENYAATLVGKDASTGLRFAHVVPRKGAVVEWIGKAVHNDIVKMGHHGKVRLRSDQEPALMEVLGEVAKLRGEARTLIEHSATGDSQANGMAERAVQTIEEMVRVYKLDIERRVSAQIEVTSVAFAWLVEYAADMVNKFLLGKDGRSAYHRLKGYGYSCEIMPFGSLVLFRVSGKVQGGLMTERWHDGIWLGKRFNTEEHLIAREDGTIIRARSIRPRNMELTKDMLDKITGAPWQPSGTVSAKDDNKKMNVLERTVENKTPSLAPRRTQITKQTIQELGPTPGCKKCRTTLEGDRSQPTLGHSEECRKRIEPLMREKENLKEKVQRSEDRRDRFLAQEMQRSVERDASEETNSRGQKRQGDVLEQDNTRSSSSSKDHRRDTPIPSSPQPRSEPLRVGTHGDSDVNTPGRKRERGGADEDEHDAQRQRINFLGNIQVEGARKRNEEPQYDVVEIFSPPRVVKECRDMNLRGGWSMDKEHHDTITNKTWDFNNERDIKMMKTRLNEDKPLLAVVSPPCTTFSNLQNLIKNPIPKDEKEEGRHLWNVGLEACRRQHRQGRGFLLEHPSGSKAWHLPETGELEQLPGVKTFMLDQCCFGQYSYDEHGEKMLRGSSSCSTSSKPSQKNSNLYPTILQEYLGGSRSP